MRVLRFLWGYRLTVWIVVFTIGVATSLYISHRADVHQQAADRREAHEDQVELAEVCVRSWDGREDIRDGDEETYRTNAETLISFSRDPERIEAYRQQVERDVARIRAKTSNPECDLTAARRLIEEEKNR